MDYFLPIWKFNNSIGATLCNNCRTIITIGLTEDLFCKNCLIMSKKELLEQLYLQARMDRNTVSIACLGTMKGEIENLLKTSKEDVDTLIEKYAIKSKKALLEFKPANYEEELLILEYFLPKQLSIEEITEKIKTIMQQNEGMHSGKLMGICMKEFKGTDPNIVKDIISKLS